MAKFLANENVPGEVVELSPGADDDGVLVTFDKDFDEMTFRQGKVATC